MANGRGLCSINEPSPLYVVGRRVGAGNQSRGYADIGHIHHSARAGKVLGWNIFRGIDFLHNGLPDRACSHVAIGRSGPGNGRRLRDFSQSVAFPYPDRELGFIANKPSIGFSVLGPGFSSCGTADTKRHTGRIGIGSDGRDHMGIEDPLHHFGHGVRNLRAEFGMPVGSVLKNRTAIGTNDFGDPNGRHAHAVIREGGVRLRHV